MEAKVEASRPICGIIGPISASAGHPAEFWTHVRTLLNRTIERAGFVPRNVWEGSQADRISSTLLSTIVTCESCIVDISGLNPNVMFEWAIRLASKRPTIVVSDEQTTLPFDTTDFRVIKYGDGHDIRVLEPFMDEVTREIVEKQKHFAEGTYRPFLDGLHIDNVTPTVRDIGRDELILEELRALSSRLLTTGPDPVFAVMPIAAYMHGRNVQRGKVDIGEVMRAFDEDDRELGRAIMIDRLNSLLTRLEEMDQTITESAANVVFGQVVKETNSTVSTSVKRADL